MVACLSTSPCVHGKVELETVVCGAGADCVSSADPKVGFNRPNRSVRTIFARETAPAMLSWPAPWSSVLKPASGCAVYMSSILTRLGVKLEFASNSRAAAPETIGADTDVPLRYMSFILVVEYL